MRIKSKANPQRRRLRPSPVELPTLYLRFGELPVGGRSADWRGAPGSTLPGVACFKAHWTERGELEVDTPSLELALVFLSFLERPLDAYLIEGRELEDVGRCGEPLVSDARVVEKLSPRPRMRFSASAVWTQRTPPTPHGREEGA